MNGWIILDKPIGLSSSQAVGAVKRVLRQNGYAVPRIGHGGTLDPLATGVLPIALGEATKLTGHMLNARKGYRFTIGFGVETDTLDGEGEAVAYSAACPTIAALEQALSGFTGPIEQMPPAYSALKVDGRRAYELARAGQQVELKARQVTIHRLVIDGAEAAAGSTEQGLAAATLAVDCSKGTYVRSLARDIARAMGSVGHVTMLRRTRAGPFTLDQAIPLDKLEELGQERQLEQALLPLIAGLDDIPALALAPDQARLLRQGQRLIGIAAKQGLHLATDASVPVALVEVAGPEVRVVRGFNLQ